MLAAGRSSRLPGSLPKVFLRAGGQTLLGHVLRALDDAPSIGAVVVVCAESERRRAERIASRFRKTYAIVAGGARRQDSSLAGLRALPPESDPVLVHDAARPLVRVDCIEKAVAAARRHGAAVVASEMVDTVKECRAGCVRRTLDRSLLWRAETPQVARRGWLEQGFREALRRKLDVTDEAMLIEKLGHVVRIVPSREPNLKVTRPEDLIVVRALLRARGR